MNFQKKGVIRVFYTPAMVPQHLGKSTETPSPMKPKLLMDFLQQKGFQHYLEIIDNFAPFDTQEFCLAHTPQYVEGFFAGEEPYASSHGLLGIDWSKSFAESVRYTNASLYQAIRSSIDAPEYICLSPTSGFHHATPAHGGLFCAFSGQVISAVKIYRDSGYKGAFIDLDGHFGNSIENSREFVQDLDLIIPKGAHINIRTEHQEYLEDLKIRLLILEELILENKVDYVVFCHGADSHEYDDIGRQLSTEEWLTCATIFCEWLLKVQAKISKSIPVTLSLFGGYRTDHYDSVLSLHTASILQVLRLLGKIDIDYQPEVKERTSANQNK
jgi:acetoin utilization deacetylase AcuC-like enzyme